MRVCLMAAAIVLWIATSGQTPVWGQSRTSSSGTFGSRTLGGGISSPGGSSFGAGGSGLGSGSGFGTSSAGQLQGSERFVRGSGQQGNFIGTSSQEANQGFVGSRNTGANRNIRSQPGLGQYGSNRKGNSNRSSRGGRTSRTEVRTILRLGFQPIRPKAAEIAPKLQARIERISLSGAQSSEALAPVQVQVENGTATLRGVVATAHGRVLAERLALLEAGIWKVNNELVVADSAAAGKPQ